MDWIVHDAILNAERGNDADTVAAAIRRMGDTPVFVDGPPIGETWHAVTTRADIATSPLLLPIPWLQRLQHKHALLAGAAFDADVVRAAHFGPPLDDFWLNRDAVWLPWGAFARRGAPHFIHGRPERIFLRPDSGLKPFAGDIFPGDPATAAFRDAIDKIERTARPTPEIMTLAAPVRDIHAEWHVWLVDNRAIAVSDYHVDDQTSGAAPDGTAALAEQAVAALDVTNAGLDVTVDIAATPTGLRVVELNALSSSGLHGVDPDALLPAFRARVVALAENIAYACSPET